MKLNALRPTRQSLWALSLTSATKSHSAERHTKVQNVQLLGGHRFAALELLRYSYTPSSKYSFSRVYVGVPVDQTTGVHASPSQHYRLYLKR